MDKIGAHTYVIAMPYRGKIVNRVQNIRNLFKVKAVRDESKENESEEVSLDSLWNEEESERERNGSEREADDASSPSNGMDIQDERATRSGRVIRPPDRLNYQ